MILVLQLGHVPCAAHVQAEETLFTAGKMADDKVGVS